MPDRSVLPDMEAARAHHRRRDEARRQRREELRMGVLERARSAIRHLVLERSLEKDLAAIDRLYAELGEDVVGEGDPEEALIVKAYRLHNLYNACERMFRAIATVFEKQIDEEKGHRQLLERMALDLSPLRPAVIDDAALEKLDELRRFRHFFRSAYDVPFDPERLAIAQRKALALRDELRQQIEDFSRFLAELRDDRT